MRLHVLSDIHLEFAPFDPPSTGADAVVLAGDIHTQLHGVEWALHAFRGPVIYVAGNHEYYGGHFRNTLRKMRQFAAGTHVHVLDGEALVIGGVRFLAATLWTDFAITGDAVAAQRHAGERMTDYRRIRTTAYRKLRPPDTRRAHAQARKFLATQLAEPFAGKTVVVTHHAPSAASIAVRFQGDDSHLNAAYVSDLESLFGPRVSLWVHGHTHFSFDYERAGTRIVCNPRGYVPFEVNPDFDPARVVEV